MDIQQFITQVKNVNYVVDRETLAIMIGQLEVSGFTNLKTKEDTNKQNFDRLTVIADKIKKCKYVYIESVKVLYNIHEIPVLELYTGWSALSFFINGKGEFALYEEVYSANGPSVSDPHNYPVDEADVGVIVLFKTQGRSGYRFNPDLASLIEANLKQK